ncbi:3-deoxy-D-manno-octulosonic acid kinase [Endozoicomonas sp. G2_1]|uniref:3-deoxy-D-manno-octulosonic acid kinase n=1 Tax=Endozoicomonas sp. G2_1 TaxID=2821091 RepID=UPI001ADA0CE0|nr:3-deoxy-D-manno-octulosonic acid kinase [Endozoicomonas sp. G2_1]MBO9489995.1 3-deoxy-D-manno-octulosonic acid kinase [Endozoicomonas sp. G2_1]
MNPSTIVKPCREKVLHLGNNYCLFSPSLTENCTVDYFVADYWSQQQAVVGTAKGRGTTWFVDATAQATASAPQQWVLKHYYRGGLIGKFNKDSYWFNGFENTRAVQEFKLLNTLADLNLPAPQAVACKVSRHLLSYKADLITTRVENASDLVGILTKQTVSDDLWRKVGACIKRFHQAGIYHDDLNCHNILIDNHDKVWLIDFDRGQQRAVESSWQQANLARLKRSFEKELTRLPTFYFQQTNWQTLLEGYRA